MNAHLSPGLPGRLTSLGLTPTSMFEGRGPWEVWLLLRERWGRRASLVDLYELEAAALGVRPELLPEQDRTRLKARARPVCYPDCQPVLPGTDRPVDPHEIHEYDAGWAAVYDGWRGRIGSALGGLPRRVDHVGSTAVPGLAAKPVIDIMVGVPDTAAEPAYLPSLLATGLVLRMREPGHLLLWPPPEMPREVHVHVCDLAGDWGRDELLFRDYLRAEPAVRDAYASAKRDLVDRWGGDRKAYTEAKTSFVLDALDDARLWAARTGWDHTSQEA